MSEYILPTGLFMIEDDIDSRKDFEIEQAGPGAEPRGMEKWIGDFALRGIEVMENIAEKRQQFAKYLESRDGEVPDQL